METKPLPRYAECTYKLFISYNAHDHKSNNEWVDAVDTSLKAYLDDNTAIGGGKFKTHKFTRDEVAGGVLGPELKTRIEESFAMLLIVGNGYAKSEYCRLELEHFLQTFGEDALKSRLFIAVMSLDALTEVMRGPVWSKYIAPRGRMAYVEMVDPDDTSAPLPPWGEDGSRVAPKLFKKVHALCKHVEDRIRDDLNAGVASPPAVAKQASAAHPRVAIGPPTEDLEPAVERLQRFLEERDFDVKRIGVEALVKLSQRVPDDTAVRRALEGCDHLILPVSYAPPLFDNHPGGHLAMLDEVGRRTLPIVWFGPPDGAPATEGIDVGHHLAFLQRVNAAACRDEAAVASALAEAAAVVSAQADKTVDANDQVAVVMQKDPYQRLVGQLVDKEWQDMGVKRGASLCIRPTSDFGASIDQSKAVILMHSPGRSIEATRAQVDKVQRAQRSGLPAILAQICEPNQPVADVGDKVDIGVSKVEIDPRAGIARFLDEESRQWVRTTLMALSANALAS